MSIEEEQRIELQVKQSVADFMHIPLERITANTSMPAIEFSMRTAVMVDIEVLLCVTLRSDDFHKCATVGHVCQLVKDTLKK